MRTTHSPTGDSHTHTARSMYEGIDHRNDNVRKRFRATVRYRHGRRWRGPWRALVTEAVEDARAFRHFRDTGALYKLRGI